MLGFQPSLYAAKWEHETVHSSCMYYKRTFLCSFFDQNIHHNGHSNKRRYGGEG